jgi:hypothetical protein
MITHEFLSDARILVLRPAAPLEAGDFTTIASEVDPIIKRSGGLKGLCIEARQFPGWKDFHAFLAHLKFVHEHQSKFARLAVVTDDPTLARLPEIIDRLHRFAVQ